MQMGEPTANFAYLSSEEGGAEEERKSDCWKETTPGKKEKRIF